MASVFNLGVGLTRRAWPSPRSSERSRRCAARGSRRGGSAARSRIPSARFASCPSAWSDVRSSSSASRDPLRARGDGPRLRGPRRAARDRARRGRDTGLHASRHARRCARDDARAGEGDRRAHRAREHLPPAAAARAGAGEEVGRPARVHGLGRADPDRLGRLPGVQPEAQGDHARRRALQERDRRLVGVAHSRALDRDPARARRRHHHGVRRVHAVPGHAGACAARRRELARVAPPLRRGAPDVIAGAVPDRTGIGVPRAARALR